MFLSSLSKYRDFGLLILRVGLGFMFILHGWPKLLGGPAGWSKLGAAVHAVGIHFSEPLGFMHTVFGFMAAFSETVGGLFLILGLLFRPACILLLCTMIIATAMHARAGDSFMNTTSRPLELAIVFAGLLFVGPGKFSFDKN